MPAAANFTAQLSAIAWLRWRLFVNALRTARGQLELASRVLVSIAFAIFALGGAFGMGVSAYIFLSHGKPQLLALFLWIVFLFWQVFPIMASAFSNAPDSSELLRFPLSYRSYFLVRLAYGAFDPASAIGGIWTLGILIGVSFAKPTIFPWALLVLATFALFNILFMQMIFAWVERWLAQRRSREIMGVLFILLMLGVQLIGPLTGHFGRRPHPQLNRFLAVAAPVQALLPPGLSADSIVEGIYPQWPVALSSLALLCAFAIVIGYGLHVRLLAQYHGENLSEVVAPSASPADRHMRAGWNVPGFAPPVAAVFEKEVRYLLRSGPMLLTLIMPFFMLFIFRFGAMNSAHHAAVFSTHTPALAFPLAAAYAILMLTNLIYNNFGGDAAGIQFFYASPVTFRHIVLAKNLTHAGILTLEVIVAWIVVSFLYRRPALDVAVTTLAALLFAAPLNFAVGNVLSIYSPRKIDYAKFGRQRASQFTALISIGIQFVIVGISVSVFWMGSYFGNTWVATLILLLLAGMSFAVYGTILTRIDRLAMERRETLVAELCRA